MTAKVKLQGGPEKTATWIWLEAGKLKIEFYDFSELAQTVFGNEIAYTLTVAEMSELYSRARQDETSLPHWITEKWIPGHRLLEKQNELSRMRRP